MNEQRVYLIDLHKCNPELIHSKLSDEDFIYVAEEQGYVYSLEGFSEAYNKNSLDSLFIHSVIRIL